MEIQSGLVLFVFVASITPGPNNIMIMASGLNYGVRRSIPHLAGIVFGVPSLLLAIGFGLGYVFERYHWLHQLIQVFGIGYLIFLAYKIASTAPTPTVGTRDDLSTKQDRPLSFFQAAMFQWVNPKAWVMGSSAIATYSAVGSGSDKQILGIVAVFFLFTLPAVGSWLVFGAALKRWLGKPSRQRAFNLSMGALLVISIAPTAWGLVVDLLF